MHEFYIGSEFPAYFIDYKLVLATTSEQVQFIPAVNPYYFICWLWNNIVQTQGECLECQFLRHDPAGWVGWNN